MPALLGQAGAQPNSQPRWTAIHVGAAKAGLISNRAALHDPSIGMYARFYGGQPDVLLDGLNIEVTPQQTWKHRPGTSILGLNTSVYPNAPLTAFTYYNPDGTIKLYIDTATGVYLHNSGGAPTLIFTKSAGAGQTSFLQLGNVMYFANGVDSKKIINGVTWNWASAGPSLAPVVAINSIGAGAAAGIPWSANTVFTTMGLLKDANGNIQQLININADASNTTSTVIGTSGVGAPIFPTTGGSTVTEISGLQWECLGPVGTWAASATYQDNSSPGSSGAPSCIYDPGTGNIFIANIPGGGTGNSGSTRPNFAGVPLLGSTSRETGSGPKWYNIGPPTTWQPSHTYTQYFSNSGRNDPTGFVTSPTLPKAAGIGGTNPQAVYLQACITVGGGVSDSSHTGPQWSTTAVNPITNDGQLAYQYLSSGTWVAATQYSAWQNGSNNFSVIYDGANLQVCVTGGTSAGSAPAWQTGYGVTTIETTGVTWVCVGSSMAWNPSVKWFLPSGGFQPPSKGVAPYGGASIVDSNSNAEFCTNSGKSAGSAPAWPTTISGTVTETSGPTWTLTALASTFKGSSALAFSKGYGYVYCFKARTATDFYVANAPNGSTAPLGAPTGSGTGGMTQASPVFKMATGNNAGAIMQLSGNWPTDLQYDTVVVFRSTDGFQGGPYLEVTEIAVPAAVNGVVHGQWSFFDSVTDVNLNALIEGDVIGENAPPPAGLRNIDYHMNRVVGSVGNVLRMSSGPDIPPDNGNGAEGWAPINNFPLKSPISRLIPQQSGLFAFTTADVYIVAGGPAITSYFPWPIAKGLGLLSPNAIQIVGGEIYMYTADRRFIAYQPGVGHTEIGFFIADKLAAFSPSSVYVTEHASDVDSSAFYVGNGSTGWHKLNPHSTPGAFSGNDAVWSPFAQIVGGCQMLISLQTSPGVRQLLVGGTSNGPILKRDLGVNTDNGTTFGGFFTIGSLVVAHPGQLAELGFVTCQFSKQGNPVVKYLVNEIAGDFNEFSSWQYDPPLVYGDTGVPSSYSPRRYYFKQTVANTGDAPEPLLARHLMLRVDYPAENAAHEMYDFTLNGALHAEK